MYSKLMPSYLSPRIVAAAACLLAVSLTPVTRAQSYTAVTVPSSYAAVKLNNKGQLFVEITTALGPKTKNHAGIWTAGKIVSLPAPHGKTSVRIADFNDAGGAVGTCEVAGTCTFRWQGRNVIPLDATFTPVFINNRGDIAGYRGDPFTGVPAILNDGGYTPIPLRGTPKLVGLGAFNDRGVAFYENYAAERFHGATWDGTSLVDLGVHAFPVGMNTSGQVVGTWEDSAIIEHAAVWNHGTLVKLDSKNTVYEIESTAYSINAQGVIVGVASDGTKMWVNQKPVDLDTLVKSALPTGTVFFPRQINDLGQILGLGQDQNGYNARQYLLTPTGVTPPAAPPDFTALPRSYDAPVVLTMSDATPQAVIHYTVDGSAPTDASPTYSAPLVISRTTTVRAAATAPAYGLSDLSSGTYVIAQPTMQSPAVNLGAVAIVHAIGTEFGSLEAPGIDGIGGQIAGDLLGSSLNWNASEFNLLPPDQANGVSDSMIPLPGGSYNTLNILAVGVLGNQLSQSFVISYTDGTSTTQQRNMSDWAHPQNYANESIALQMSYRANSGADLSAGPYALYGYSFDLDPTKVPKWITLPKNPNVVIVGVAMADPVGADRHVNVALVANISAVTTESHALIAGADGHGNAFAGDLLGSSVAWNGSTFAIADQSFKNGVAAATIPLPAGQFHTLKLLGTGVNGAQVSQSFVIHYSDGTSEIKSLSLSDWRTSQAFAGETIAATMAYRIDSGGNEHAGPYHLYGYSLSLDPSRAVQSLSMPAQMNVIILGLTLAP